MKSIPKAALFLGLSGLLPFAALGGIAVYQAPAIHPGVYSALMAYGAIILSFLGGVRWGLAINAKSPSNLTLPLIISVTPSLIAWLSLLVRAEYGIVVLTISFLLMMLLDFKLQSGPAWYLTLRTPLSLGVLTCLFAVLVA